MKQYTDNELGECSRQLHTKIQENADAINHKHEMLSAEFENFKQRDFRDLEGRVSALEKKFARLLEQFQNFKIPD